VNRTTPGASANSHSPTRFIARQPIFDAQEEVYAYELLFRSGTENRYTATDGDAAARDVADHFLSAGARTLTAGRRAFINCTREFLVNEYATVLPKAETVIEILETVEPDAEVLAACCRLRDRGYMLALDDFVYADKFQPFIELASIIKMDFRLSSPAECWQAVERFAPQGIRMLAEKVETRDEFAAAREHGYVYFQGYFFCQPQIVPSRHIPAFKTHYLRILQAVSQPELDHDQIAGLIDREVSLCYKLLRFVNSALLGFRREVVSTRHAMEMLGDHAVRKWASVAAVLGIAGNKPSELVMTSLTRGRCCELLVTPSGAHRGEPDLFLLGVLSLMDVMLGRPIAEIAAEIALPDAVRAALLGEPNRPRQILDLVIAYEGGQWHAVSNLARELHQDEAHLSAAYVEAVDWAQKVFQA
jgi:EAL and modified HD-GYP domain-containing signal transduction protein